MNDMAAVLFKLLSGVSKSDHKNLVQLRYSGDYGRVEGKKVFMGVAQIMIDDLDLSNIVIGKFFATLTLC